LTEPCLPEFFTDTYPALAGVIMMASMFMLFVIEMYLTAKVGGHSHGGPTGQSAPRDTHHHQHNHDHKGPSYKEKTNYRPEYKTPSPESVALAAKKEQVQLEENFLQVSAVSGEPMPAWFVVFYEQYIRQRIETINMIKQYYTPIAQRDEEYGYDLKKVSTFDSDVTLLEDREEQPADPQLLRKMNMHISLLEGGILFHSIFVGITISITSDGFIVLLTAIVFHQMFEGVGLGSRIASVPYPAKSIRPWVLVAAFGMTCPIGQAIGLATRETYDPESAYGLITVGVFNAMYVHPERHAQSEIQSLKFSH
jgi:solute carrier family 39 (zinc transporter), member 1/2/3